MLLAAPPPATDELPLGMRAHMREHQPIRPTPPGRSFASTAGVTPLHTDSQDFLGAPPDLQVMRCVRAAREGGESLLLDGWELLALVSRVDPSLYDALFTETRHIPFYFGTVRSPTVARKRGRVVFTHSPMPPRDAIGRALAPYLERVPMHEIRVGTGETLLVDNHRVLHGRRAFADPEREFARTLAWLDAPLSTPTFERVRDVAPPDYPPLDPARLGIVREMVAGTPPAKLAAREGVPEATLYRWRSAAYAEEFAAESPLHGTSPA